MVYYIPEYIYAHAQIRDIARFKYGL